MSNKSAFAIRSKSLAKDGLSFLFVLAISIMLVRKMRKLSIVAGLIPAARSVSAVGVAESAVRRAFINAAWARR